MTTPTDPDLTPPAPRILDRGPIPPPPRPAIPIEAVGAIQRRWPIVGAVILVLFTLLAGVAELGLASGVGTPPPAACCSADACSLASTCPADAERVELCDPRVEVVVEGRLARCEARP